MPNGFHGTQERWEQIESPLRSIDVTLRTFAKQYGMSFKANERNWPDRSLEWGRSVRKLIQIFLDDEKAMTYNFWICASEDRENQRYWKNEFLRRGATISGIQTALPNLLVEGRRKLESWRGQDLVPAVPLTE